MSRLSGARGAAIIVIAALVAVVVAVGLWVSREPERDNAAGDGVEGGWLVYRDATLGYAIDYPADGRVDQIDGRATIVNRDVACPACEPPPLRMFSLTLTPGGDGAAGPPGEPVVVGEAGYAGTMAIEGETVVKIRYRTERRGWTITGTFTERYEAANPAVEQFLAMVRSIRHETSVASPEG